MPCEINQHVYPHQACRGPSTTGSTHGGRRCGRGNTSDGTISVAPQIWVGGNNATGHSPSVKCIDYYNHEVAAAWMYHLEEQQLRGKCACGFHANLEAYMSTGATLPEYLQDNIQSCRPLRNDEGRNPKPHQPGDCY